MRNLHVQSRRRPKKNVYAKGRRRQVGVRGGEDHVLEKVPHYLWHLLGKWTLNGKMQKVKYSRY